MAWWHDVSSCSTPLSQARENQKGSYEIRSRATPKRHTTYPSFVDALLSTDNCMMTALQSTFNK